MGRGHGGTRVSSAYGEILIFYPSHVASSSAPGRLASLMWGLVHLGAEAVRNS